MSVDCFNKSIFKNIGESLFEKFVAIHVIIQNVDIAPAIMIVYNDNTFEIDVYQADIKTTGYRKVNETANKILKHDVKEIYCMQTYSYIAFSPDLLNITSAERLACAESDVLVFMKVDSELNEEEYQFEGQHLGCMNYIVNNLKNDKKGKLDIGINNMLPIIDAFKKKREASNKFLT